MNARLGAQLAVIIALLIAPTACVQAGRDDEAFIESQIRASLQREYATVPEEFRSTLQFAFKPVDLNGDGKMEVLAYLSGRLVCGTGGCTTYLFPYTGRTLGEPYSIDPAFEPILVSPRSSEGWRHIIVTDRDGAPHTISFDGQRYQDNPNDAPLTSQAERDASLPTIYEGSRRYSVF